MAQLCEAEARYDRLLQLSAYSNLAWAAELHERIQGLSLYVSGRSLATALRPCFLRHAQWQALSRSSERLSEIIAKIQELALYSPVLLNRLRMLPAEKLLAALPPGYSRSIVTSRLEAIVSNGTVSLSGIEPCRHNGVARSGSLADAFLKLAIVKKFQRLGYHLSKPATVKSFSSTLLSTWKEFGGRDVPAIGIVEYSRNCNAEASDSQLLAASLAQSGLRARVVSADRLEYTGTSLHENGFKVDIALRRVLTRELLIRSDLNHPLLRAYEDRAVCLINSFRSELAHRRCLFELITDSSVNGLLPSSDREFIQKHVPWTRFVSQRKTSFEDRQIDLLPFILQAREQMILLPNEIEAEEQRSFVGCEMDPAAWARAVDHALRSAYVVQQRNRLSRQEFPLYQYGELSARRVDVSISPQLIDGRLQDAQAILSASSVPGTLIALTPVLLISRA